MAILLKTASVRVSSIQIMQVRVQNKGKSVWKSRYDGDVSGRRAEHREGTGNCCALELVERVEGDGVLGPPERARGFEPGEGRVHLISELLKDALGGWGLSATQDAGDDARLLEAPSPLVLVVVFIPSWRWR